MNVLWLGNPLFSVPLSGLGWRVHIYNYEELTFFAWDELVALAGFEPDVLVLSDKSLPPHVLGIERFPCVTVCYAVDTHIHSWLPLYGQAFDICLVSLFDHIPFFQNKRLANDMVHWCPPAAKDDDAPMPHITPEHDCLFVGSIHPTLTPKRIAFFEELKKSVHGLHIESGAYKDLFPYGRTLINHSEQGDMNFRIFEAMGCGGCLVTPRIGHGMERFFTHGEECMLYDIDDPSEAASHIHTLLANPVKAQNMASRALEKIDSAHRQRHRAQAFMDIIGHKDKSFWQDCIRQRHAVAHELHKQFLRPLYLLMADAYKSPAMKRAYLHAARA